MGLLGLQEDNILRMLPVPHSMHAAVKDNSLIENNTAMDECIDHKHINWGMQQLEVVEALFKGELRLPLGSPLRYFLYLYHY